MSLVDRFRGLSNLYGRSDRNVVASALNHRNSQTMAAPAGLSLPAIAFPVLALGFVILAAVVGLNIPAPASPLSWVVSAAMIAIILGAVFAAVELADVIAHRVGEPYGTLVLTLAVTVIEVALIESIVLTPGSSPALARDTVFAVIMIVCNGLVGLCIMVGSLRHHEQEFQVSGASLYLNVLGALSVLTLILPNYTSTIVGPYYSTAQLLFVSTITVVLYGTFLFIQTSRHKNYFRAEDVAAPDGHHMYPSNRAVAVSVIMLLMALTGVILLSKKFAVILEIGLNRLGAPQAVAGIVIAMVVLAPESITALRAAQHAAEESEPRARLLSGDDRPYHTGRGGYQRCFGQAARGWALIPRCIAACADAFPKRSDLCIRPHQYSCRSYSSACIRHVPVFGFHSLKGIRQLSACRRCSVVRERDCALR